ncbi:MAG: FliH/SctL family protein [Nitrospirota bacterium]
MTQTNWSKIVKADLAEDSAVAAYNLREVSGILAPRHGGGPSGRGTGERNGYEEGFASGQRAGRDAGLKETEAARRALAALMTELTTLRSALLARYEQELVGLVFAAADRVLGGEAARHPELPLAYIREAVDKLGRTDRIVIRAHPDDVDRLTRELAAHAPDQGPQLRVEADPSLRQGECVAETPQRAVDARWTSQLAALDHAVRRGDAPS